MLAEIITAVALASRLVYVRLHDGHMVFIVYNKYNNLDCI